MQGAGLHTGSMRRMLAMIAVVWVCLICPPPLVSQYLVHYLLALSRWVDAQSLNKSRVGQVSWSLLNDCFRTPLCRRHKPDWLATAVLYLAVRLVGLTVPCQGARRPWWEVSGLL